MRPLAKLFGALLIVCSAMPIAVADDTGNNNARKAAPGPLQDERERLWKDIGMLNSKGVGTKAYETAFEQLEAGVKSGDAEPAIKTELDRLNRAVADQVSIMSGNNKAGFTHKMPPDSYMADLQRRIKKGWFPAGQGHRTVVVTFKIHRDGSLSHLHLVTTSGNSVADNAALKAVERAAPFRPTPSDMKDPADIEFTFGQDNVRRL